MTKPPADIENRYQGLVEKAPYLTIATASPTGEPEAAILAFARGPGSSLYFYTLDDSRKYRNIRRNPQAALTLFNPPEYAQLNGEIEELDGDAAQTAKRTILDCSMGDREEYHGDPRCRYFRFWPRRICLRIDDGFPATYEEWDPQGREQAEVKEL